MVLNDIIEQAAGRQSGASDHGGRFKYGYLSDTTHLNNIPYLKLSPTLHPIPHPYNP